MNFMLNINFKCEIDITSFFTSNRIIRPTREGRIKTISNLSSIRALSVGHYQRKKNERIKSPYQR